MQIYVSLVNILDVQGLFKAFKGCMLCLKFFVSLTKASAVKESFDKREVDSVFGTITHQLIDQRFLTCFKRRNSVIEAV